MERKSIVLILLALCVLFILEEEVFHFDAFSTRPAAANPQNLTRNSPPLSAHRPPSSVPQTRTVLFTRSRNRYEGNYRRKNAADGRGLGLEGLVGADLKNRKAANPDALDLPAAGSRSGSSRDGAQRTREEMEEGDEEEAFIDEDDPVDELFEEEEWNREGRIRGRLTAEEEDEEEGEDEEEKEDEESRGGGGEARVVDDGVNGIAMKLENTFDEQAEAEKMKHSPFIYREEEDRQKKLAAGQAKDVKYISYYLPWGREEHKKQFRFCRYKNCAFVNNMSLADLVVFKASDIRDHPIPYFYRPKGQRWLMYTADPAIRKYALTRPDVASNFNWTLTYQLDADAPRIFGRLKKQTQPDKNYDLLFDNKPRQAAWFVSHCETWSKREVYVKRMQRVMEVDIFGQCGNLTCGVSHYRRNDKNLCLPMLTNEYKFYLSFENSFCPDYITEKFFKLFQDIQAIPVVRGGFDYKKYLPSGIFVDASDFKSPEALAKYLIDLGKDKQRYVDMLRRKDSWLYIASERRHCRMCEHLNTHWNHVGYHPNLRHKFNGNPASCWDPPDL